MLNGSVGDKLRHQAKFSAGMVQSIDRFDLYAPPIFVEDAYRIGARARGDSNCDRDVGLAASRSEPLAA
jgi:hypothetical protein